MEEKMSTMRIEGIVERLLKKESPPEEYTMAELCDVWNLGCVRMDAPNRQIKGFRDHPTAVRRVSGMLVELRALKEIDRRDPPGRKRLLDSGQAEEIRQQVVRDQERAAAIAADRPTTARPEPEDPPSPAPKGHRGRASAFGDRDKITVRHKGDNPKRGSAAARYALYRTGMTVAEYVKAVGSRGQAMRDLRWDVANKWVSVS
jgi:hypothetical protein